MNFKKYNMNIKGRFLEFISYKQLSKRKFQESIGVSNSYIQNISNGIGAEVLQRIKASYPELNTDWLMTGEGDMLKPIQNVSEISNSTIVGANVNGNGNNISNNDANNISGMIELQKGYQDMMRKSQEQIDRLLIVIEKLTSKR